MAFTSTQAFLVIGVVLIILEAVIPGFILLPIGLAFCLTALASLVVEDIGIQLLILAVNSVIIFLLSRRFVKRGAKSPQLMTNADALIGSEATVSEAVENDANAGYAKIFGDSWRAISADGSKISVGTKVTVTALDGNKVIVRAK